MLCCVAHAHLLVPILDLYVRVALDPVAVQAEGTWEGLQAAGTPRADAPFRRGALHAAPPALPRSPAAVAAPPRTSPHSRLHLALWIRGLGGGGGHAGKELSSRPRLPGVGTELHQYP